MWCSIPRATNARPCTIFLTARSPWANMAAWTRPIAGPFLFHEAGASSLIRPPTWLPLPLPLLWLAIVLHQQVHPLVVADLVITAEGRRVTLWVCDWFHFWRLLFEKPNKKAPVTVPFWWIAAPSGLALAF